MTVRDHFRALARQPVHLSGRLHTPAGSSHEIVRLHDLGLGGASLQISDPLAPGILVRLELSVPHLWDPLVLDARVAWSRETETSAPARIGLCFEHTSGKTLRWLVELLDAENYE